jgi:hypothetical protein
MINIIVEGIADKKFLEDYLSHLGTDKNNFKVICINGKDNLSYFENEFKKNTNNGELNLIIFDTDNDFNIRKEFLLNFKEENELEFQLFLFPNNKDEGDLETLLENIIPENNVEIMNCWSNYENCISSLNRKLTIPANKSKIHTYLEVLLDDTQKGKKKAKEKNRDYKDKDHWNLDSDYLLSLKEFLLDSLNTLK